MRKKLVATGVVVAMAVTLVGAAANLQSDRGRPPVGSAVRVELDRKAAQITSPMVVYFDGSLVSCNDEWIALDTQGGMVWIPRANVAYVRPMPTQ